MEASTSADDFIPAGLAALGIEADEIDLAVMGASTSCSGRRSCELLALDTRVLEPERIPTSRRPPE
jgi:hypothetical protein